MSCSIPSPSPSPCPLLIPTRLFLWQQQNPLRACKHCLCLCFLSLACFPLFSQTLTADSWLLPILVWGPCLLLLLIVPARMQDVGKKMVMHKGLGLWLLCWVSILRFVCPQCIIHHHMPLLFDILIFLCLCLSVFPLPLLSFPLLSPLLVLTNRVHWEQSYRRMIV